MQTIMQGDSFGIPIDVTKLGGQVVLPSEVNDVEVSFGHLIKYYSKDEVLFDDISKQWVFPITQEESFGLPVSQVRIQVRVFWKDGNIRGADAGEYDVVESISKEVLKCK